jgi:CRP/FNR family transcriptional regulator
MHTSPDYSAVSVDRPGFLARLPAVLLSGAHRVTYRRGDAIWRPGSEPRLGVVERGCARVFITADDGRQATLRYAREGDPLGLVRFFVADVDFGIDAVAATTVLYFDEADFNRALATDPALLRTVAEHLAATCCSGSRTIRSYAFCRVRQRVAAHLLSLATPDAGGQLTAPLTQQELAGAVGSVRDVVARALRELSDAGLVVTSHRRVVITDEDALRDEASDSDERHRAA